MRSGASRGEASSCERFLFLGRALGPRGGGARDARGDRARGAHGDPAWRVPFCVRGRRSGAAHSHVAPGYGRRRGRVDPAPTRSGTDGRPRVPDQLLLGTCGNRVPGGTGLPRPFARLRFRLQGAKLCRAANPICLDSRHACFGSMRRGRPVSCRAASSGADGMRKGPAADRDQERGASWCSCPFEPDCGRGRGTFRLFEAAGGREGADR